MKKLLYLFLFAILLFVLAACGDENVKQENEQLAEQQENTSNDEWVNKINEIANNENPASKKFKELELFMMEYKENIKEDEVEKFKNDIINDYKSGTYLNELDNHERMLTNIFKAYIVERKTEGAIKDFAFDYFQNLKYTYRGVDAVDSESVKSNEEQMNKALEQMK